MTIFEAYNFTKNSLDSFGIEDFVYESKEIIKHITGFNAPQILTHYNNQLTEYQINNLNSIIGRRQIRYPLQYVFGTWEFYGRPFKVGPGVLIPRSDTETVVEEALELLSDNKTPEILDLCAGSGCIGITLACEKPEGRAIMVEKYPEAMNYALENRKLNYAENTVCIEGDVFEKSAADGKYDLIVSNPPYIPQEEMKLTSPETKYEPETALLAEDGGLVFYKFIIENYADCIKPGGAFCFEVGFSQSEAVAELLRAADFKNINTRKDLNGIGRAVSGKKQ